MPFSTQYHDHQRTNHIEQNVLHYSKLEKLSFMMQKIFLLSNEAKKVILLQNILAFAQGLGSFFFTIFIWRQTQSLIVISVYHLIYFPSIMSMYFVLGFFKKNLNVAQYMRIGIILNILMYIPLLISSDHSPSVFWLVAVIHGLAVGSYWSANHILSYKYTEDSTRDNFYALNSAIGSIIGVITPFLATIILSLGIDTFENIPFNNYYILFGVVMLILTTGLIFSLILPSIKAPHVRISDLKIPMNLPVWKILSIRTFIDGFKQSSEAVLGTILLYQIFKNEFDLGIFSTLIAFSGVFVSIYIGSVLNRKKRLLYGKIGGSLLLITRSIYIILFSLPAVIFSSIINLVANPLFFIGLSATLYDAIDHSPDHENLHYIYILFMEIFLNLGRVAAVLVLLVLLQLGNDIFVAKIWYLGLGVVPLIFYYLTSKFEEKIN